MGINARSGAQETQVILVTYNVNTSPKKKVRKSFEVLVNYAPIETTKTNKYW
jgi:hypothetical protein